MKKLIEKNFFFFFQSNTEKKEEEGITHIKVYLNLFRKIIQFNKI
jgi:hypothetical protein